MQRYSNKKEKGPEKIRGPYLLNTSLTMSYFHTGTRTIIGAEVFHCPVRDGKEWDHLAMVIRLNRSLHCVLAQINEVQVQPICRVLNQL